MKGSEEIDGESTVEDKEGVVRPLHSAKFGKEGLE